jgi:hypothetical protein
MQSLYSHCMNSFGQIHDCPVELSASAAFPAQCPTGCLYGNATLLAYANTVHLYSIMATVRLLTRSSMTTQRATRTDYTAVPFDFPHEPGGTHWNRCVTWNICEELALHLASECAQLHLESDRSVRPIDILLKSYRLVEALGWGEPPLLRWVIQRVAALLNWSTPDIARQR